MDAKKSGIEVEELKEKNNLGDVNTYDNIMYEAQATLNFFTARIKPFLEKDEPPAAFDRRYREWRIRECEECKEEFAYAYAYEGIKFCSLDCLAESLQKMGLRLTIGRDLKKRWGPHYHPAIVPSSAFGALQEVYGASVPEAFERV